MYIAALIHPGFASLVAARPSQSTQGCAPRPVARKIDAQKGEEMVKISVRHYKNNVIFMTNFRARSIRNQLNLTGRSLGFGS